MFGTVLAVAVVPANAVIAPSGSIETSIATMIRSEIERLLFALTIKAPSFRVPTFFFKTDVLIFFTSFFDRVKYIDLAQ